MLPQSMEGWREMLSIAGAVGVILTFLLFWAWRKRLEEKWAIPKTSPFYRSPSKDMYIIGGFYVSIFLGTFAGLALFLALVLFVLSLIK